MTNPTVKPGKGVRLEGAILVLIVVSVGLAAGAASFTHVKEWTMANSPDGTGVWFGWANAVITELVPTASALAIRRRRRTNPHASIGYPVTLMALAVTASLTAQLAVARPTVFGWFVSALPALAFLGLTRLVLHSSHNESVSVPGAATAIPATPPIPAIPATTNPIPTPVPATASTPDTVEPGPAAPVVVATPADMPRRQPQQRPAPRPSGPQPVPADVRPSAARTARPTNPQSPLPASTPDTTTVTGSEPSQPQLPGMDLAVMAQATRIVREHHDKHATAITPGQLAVALRISTSEASKVLAALADDTDIRPVNGHRITATK